MTVFGFNQVYPEFLESLWLGQVDVTAVDLRLEAAATT